MKYRERICPLSRSVHCNIVRYGNRLKGGGRAPPTLTSMGYFFHHDGMYARNPQSPLCAYSVGNPIKLLKLLYPEGPQYAATAGTGILEYWSLPGMHDFVDHNHLNTTFTMNSSWFFHRKDWTDKLRKYLAIISLACSAHHLLQRRVHRSSRGVFFSEAKFLDVIRKRVLEFSFLLFTVTSTKGFYSPTPLSKSVSRLVCKVNIAYGNLKAENSQDYFQKPQRNCMFMNLASSIL